MPENKTICVLPFHHLDIRSTKKVHPCCFFDPEEIPEGFDLEQKNIFDHPFIQDLRSRMKKGEHIKGCKICYETEDRIGKSFRTEMLDHYRKKFNKEFSAENVKLTYINLALSNICNSKCRMCKPEYSTSWYQDAKLLGIPINKGSIEYTTAFDDIDFSSIKTINLLGGEPLMEQEKFIEILEKCNLEDLFLIITTNCTLIPSEKLFNLTKKCSNVKWNISIDSFGEMNDFLRKGSKWKDVIENLTWFYANYENLEINTAISIYNCNIADLLNIYLKDHFPKINHRQILIEGPPWMEIKNLPSDAKNFVRDLITEKKNQSDIDKLILGELEKSGNTDLFISMDKKLNDLRKESWKDLNPRLFNFLKEYYV